jgi:D-alanyl-lipoteichoic acid acyltransferase DltB (MBOAT superfamily)
MFSWSVYWITSVCLGIGGASVKSPAANTVFQFLLLLGSLVLIVFGLKVSLVPLLILLGFALFAVMMIRFKQSVLWVIVPMLLVWSIAKCIGFVLIPSLSLVAFVGISYFVVKLFTLLRDYQSGLVKNPRMITILNYLFFAPTFLAGPMHYYREFDKSVKAPKLPTAQEVIPLVFRILWGAVKVLVLSPFLVPKGLPVPADYPVTSVDLIIRACVFTFQLYFEFSGYSDMAIGSSKLMGIDTPENFNNPLLSRNVVEFWQRWHITLMRAITAYVYVPLARRLAVKKTLNPTLTMMLAISFAFLVSGFWHGARLNFILWGLYNALAIIVYEICRPHLTKLYKREIFAGKILPRVTRFISIGITFFVISLGWILFNLDSNAVQHSFGL